MISTVRGHFRDFDATIHIGEDAPESSSVTANIDVASIDTNEPNRDAHLRSDDFFNADAFPKITFQSTRVEKLDGTDFRLTGNLTIRDITRPVVLDGEYEGRIEDPWGNERIAFKAHTEISREALQRPLEPAPGGGWCRRQRQGQDQPLRRSRTAVLARVNRLAVSYVKPI